jgi:hypothetical protein
MKGNENFLGELAEGEKTHFPSRSECNSGLWAVGSIALTARNSTWSIKTD